MKLTDSRDPLGVGILILQDHGYRKAGFPDHSRGSIVAIRVKGRFDADGDYGEWEPDDETRGPLGGGCFWARQKTNAGAWQFVWPVVIAGNDSTTTPGPRTLRGEITPGSRPLPTPITPGPSGTVGGAGATGAVGPPPVAVIAKGSTINVGGNLIKLQQNVGGKVPVIGVGVNVKPFAVGLFPGVNFLGPFGLNVKPFGIGLPLGGDRGGGSINRTQSAPAIDEATSAWYSGDLETRAKIVNRMRPRDKSWAGDQRYEDIVQSSPEGWPDFPAGHHGLAATASNEDEQVIHYHPTDPRLIAVNAGGSPTIGTIVSDLNNGDAIDLERQARLQSMVWVVKGPSGSRGMLSINKKIGKGKQGRDVNALAWNLGPSGQFDAMGGLVVDIPIGESVKRDTRIIAHASVHYGGPFDVGRTKDIHRIGEDADGNPINSLHISTGALFRRQASPFSTNEDGPLDFGYSYPDPGDLTFPIRVYKGFDHKTGLWRDWTTSQFYTPGPVPVPETPGEPVPVPETPVTPGPTGLPPREPPENPRIQPGADPVADSLDVGATTLETWFPAMGFRNQMVRTGDEDLQHSTNPSKSAVARMDDRAPLTMRIEGYGAQGGPTGGPYMGADGDWLYTQEPRTSRFRQTGSGGSVMLPPEVTLADIDEDLAPDGVTRSSTYFLAGTGVCFGAGLPELATGGLKSGYSWCANTDGELEWYSHDSSGTATLAGLGAPGQMNVVTQGGGYTVDVSDDVVLVTASVTITLPDAASVSPVKQFHVKNIGPATVTTVSTAGGALDGEASQELSYLEAIAVVSDGANWWIL